MRVLVLTREFPPHVIGGLSYHLAHLYSEIVDAGHEVTVVTGVASKARNTASDLVHPDISVHAVEYGPFTAQHLMVPLVLRRALGSLDVSRYDVAVTHTPLPFGLSIPLVGKYHDCPQAERQYFRRDLSVVRRLADSLVNPTRRLVDRRSFSTVEHALFNSRLCRRAWERHYEISAPRTVVYNGVDTTLFSPRTTDTSEEYALFVGDSERKGLSRIRQYAARSELPVYIVGDVDDVPGDSRQFDHVSPHVLAGLYSGAVATLHPARFEAFGNVVLESLACGTPVVTTDKCGASELLPPDCGAVTDDLSAGIEHCRALDSEACRALAREHAWQRVAEQTLSVLERVRCAHSAAP